MTILLIKITIWLAVVAGLSAFLLFGYLIYEREQQLKEFRANLRIGDMARFQRFDGQMVRVRLLRRDSHNMLFVMDINERGVYTTTIDNIFRP